MTTPPSKSSSTSIVSVRACPCLSAAPTTNRLPPALRTFFAKFDQFADAPNAVAKMRELVLGLAFSGGLTGAGRSEEGLPDGWEKRTIESIATSISSGFACSRSHQVEGGHVHLRTHNISTLGTLNFDLLVRIDPRMVDQQKASIRAGDILFNNTNSQELVGKTSLVDRDYNYGFSNHITRIRLNEGIFPGFVVFYLTFLRNEGYFARLCTRWINQAAVNTDTLKGQIIPLPPLAEQKRIVAKVDELMAVCDRLEAQQQERETRHIALARASLARFADAPTHSNLNLLFHPSFSIPPADLRKSILTLAVQGKLVPQDPEDEPAEKLLSRIVANKPRLRDRFQVTSDPMAPEHDLATCPKSWGIVELGRLMKITSSKRIFESEYTDAGIPFFRSKEIGDLSRGENIKTTLYISVERYSELQQHTDFPKPGDLLLTSVGTIGNTWIVDDREFYFKDGNITQIVRVDGIDMRYVQLYIASPLFKDAVDRIVAGTAYSALTIVKIKALSFPLPPLAEQRRIVAKVDQLMALVDQLEAQLAASRATAANLLEAVVAELTG